MQPSLARQAGNLSCEWLRLRLASASVTNNFFNAQVLSGRARSQPMVEQLMLMRFLVLVFGCHAHDNNIQDIPEPAYTRRFCMFSITAPSSQCEVRTQRAASMPESHVVPFRVLDLLFEV